MVDDILENLRTAQRLGMKTVWVSPVRARRRAVIVEPARFRRVTRTAA